MKKIAWMIFILLMPSTLSADQTACTKATRLVQQAYDMGPGSYAAQKEMLNQAIQLCPDHPEAHNNLGTILETEKNYGPGLAHYLKAVSARPDFAEAWFGVGEIYYKTGRFALALEAYLKGCRDKDALAKADELLNSQRYRISEPGEIADKENLSLLFDKGRRSEIERLRKACGFKAVVEPEYIFRNILFDTGSATLEPGSHRQIHEIGATLRSVGKSTVIISGHTDQQPFKGHSQEDSNRLNMRLSENRAATVAQELIRMGIPGNYIRTKGFGPTEPLAKGDSPEAYAQNRRVTVEVRDKE